jgi:6-phosphogluconolactonase
MMNRRWILSMLVAGLAQTGGSAQEAPPLQGTSTLVYIGTHTGDKARGIYLFRLQSAGTDVFQNVTLVPLGLAAEAAHPTFFEIDAKRRLLFAVNEVDQFDGKPGGAVSAFAIDDGLLRRFCEPGALLLWQRSRGRGRGIGFVRHSG